MADPSSLENIDSDQKPETNRVARPQYSTLTVDSERISEAAVKSLKKASKKVDNLAKNEIPTENALSGNGEAGPKGED